jgi:hypothetical protein
LWQRRISVRYLCIAARTGQRDPENPGLSDGDRGDDPHRAGRCAGGDGLRGKSSATAWYRAVAAEGALSKWR